MNTADTFTPDASPAQSGRRLYRWLAQGLSHVFHPLFSLTYAALIICNYSQMVFLPMRAKVFFVGEVVFYTVLFPVLIIMLLHKFHVIGHWSLRDVRDRTLPFLTNLICFTTNFLVMQRIQSLPQWVLVPYFASILLMFVAWVVSFWWKISAHASGNAACATFITILYYYLPDIVPLWLVFGWIIVLGLVCTARLYLGRHTLGQVAAGTLLGVITMHIAAGIYF